MLQIPFKRNKVEPLLRRLNVFNQTFNPNTGTVSVISLRIDEQPMQKINLSKNLCFVYYALRGVDTNRSEYTGIYIGEKKYTTQTPVFSYGIMSKEEVIPSFEAAKRDAERKRMFVLPHEVHITKISEIKLVDIVTKFIKQHPHQSAIINLIFYDGVRGSDAYNLLEELTSHLFLYPKANQRFSHVPRRLATREEVISGTTGGFFYFEKPSERHGIRIATCPRAHIGFDTRPEANRIYFIDAPQ